MLNKKIEIGNVAKDALEFGRLFIDIKSKKVELEGLAIPLTKSEYEIFLMLASEPLKVYSRQQIINVIRDNLACITKAAIDAHILVCITEATIDAHIHNLRKKLGYGSCCILNHQGFGYEFDPSILIKS